MTAKSRSALNSDADTLLPDNTTGDISPADIRGRVKDLADSAFNLGDDDASDIDLATAILGETDVQGALEAAAKTGQWDIILEDQRSPNTSGGSSSAGDNTRTINTVVLNRLGIAAPVSNQFELPAGTYDFLIIATAFRTDRTRVLLFNVTDSAKPIQSMTNYFQSNLAVGGEISAAGRLTIASSKTFRISHLIETAKANDGFGVAGNFYTETYLRILIKKVLP